MPGKLENPGSCTFCKQFVARREVQKHLANCPKWQAELEDAAGTNRPAETLWQVRVQDSRDKDFWLILEMRGSATLNHLDRYLRAIWLECCGHLSEFRTVRPAGKRVGKARQVDTVFAPGVVLRHIFDFGTTSTTEIKVIGSRQGPPTSRDPITLLARNRMLEAVCQECGQPASWLCVECQYETEQSGHLCNEHYEDHPHEEFNLYRFFNSPRSGVCAYDGPALPPY